MRNNSLKISIVTVCYNAVATIEATMRSVLDQTYDNIEYIIIDGGSTDGTVDIIRRYVDDSNYGDRVAHWVSEPDQGIYDAMNKGIAAATGDYINFMNSGDTFYNSAVIEDVFSEKQTSDVIFGDTWRISKNYNFRQLNLPLSDFNKTLPFCHQSSFAKVDLMKKYGFDTSFRSAADYNFFYKLWTGGYRFKHIPILISIFDGRDGFSAVNLSIVRKEEARVVGIDNKLSWKIKTGVSMIFQNLKNIIKKILPESAVKRINLYNVKKDNDIKNIEDIGSNGEL